MKKLLLTSVVSTNLDNVECVYYEFVLPGAFSCKETLCTFIVFFRNRDMTGKSPLVHVFGFVRSSKSLTLV